MAERGRMKTSDAGLKIAYILLTASAPLSTKELSDRADCDRKTVYDAIDRLELAGFVTNVFRQGNGSNYYSCKLNY